MKFQKATAPFRRPLVIVVIIRSKVVEIYSHRQVSRVKLPRAFVQAHSTAAVQELLGRIRVVGSVADAIEINLANTT